VICDCTGGTDRDGEAPFLNNHDKVEMYKEEEVEFANL
jgi:hypothetical protein